MRALTFANRTLKEQLRDPLTLFFGLAFPIILLLIMAAIMKNVPAEASNIDILAPGVAVFGLSFLSIFAGLTIAKDRTSAFLERLYTTPLTATDMILGYILPLIPFALLQATLMYIVGLIMGLTPTPHIMVGILAIVPSALLFISIGLLFGSVLNEKAVGGTIGSILPVVTGLLGGCWMDLSIMGEGVETFAMCLPFANAVELEKCIVNGTYTDAWQYFLVILTYLVVIMIAAILVFLKQMKKR